MFDEWNRVLIVSSHTDDAELAMGGTINRLMGYGHEIYHLVLSDAKEQAELRGYKWNVLRNECIEANKVLGIEKKSLHLYADFPVNHFDKYRQSIADMLHKHKRAFNPDVVFVSSSFDTHQDHQVTHQEARRVFKDVGILGYEFPYNNLSFNYDMMVGLTDENMSRKLDACKAYKSQRDRVYFDPEYIKALGKVNAVRIRVDPQYPYAEAFEVVRMTW